MAVNLTQRDYEILRTLVRVQLATSASFQGNFFSTAHLASKRFARLRSAGVIASHRKGLPPSQGVRRSGYWRITDHGIDRLLERFPDERIPANPVSRASRSSLLFFQHRDEMTACYMRLLAGKEENIEDISARADLIDWRCEYEVVLPYSKLVGLEHQAKKIVPDATLSTAVARYFLEIDRSTESGGRLRNILQRYSSAFRQPGFAGLFPDRLPPCVLYITKSKVRAKNISALIKKLELPFAAYALHTPEATEFLNEVLSGLAAAPKTAPSESATSLLGEIYDVTRSLTTECSKDSRNKAGPILRKVYDYLIAVEGSQ